VGALTEQEPPRSVIQQIIEAATWAPNHHRTQPWRFMVVAGRARAALGQVMAASLLHHLSDPESAETVKALEKEHHKPLRAPVIIAVAALPGDDPRAEPSEDLAAVAAGVENMLLAAQALGLGAIWRTGGAAADPAVKQFLGLPESAAIVAFVYLGYPLRPLPPRRREDESAAFVTWLPESNA
jgi:nitroreductase